MIGRPGRGPQRGGHGGSRRRVRRCPAGSGPSLGGWAGWAAACGSAGSSGDSWRAGAPDWRPCASTTGPPAEEEEEEEEGMWRPWRCGWQHARRKGSRSAPSQPLPHPPNSPPPQKRSDGVRQMDALTCGLSLYDPGCSGPERRSLMDRAVLSRRRSVGGAQSAALSRRRSVGGAQSAAMWRGDAEGGGGGGKERGRGTEGPRAESVEGQGAGEEGGEEGSRPRREEKRETVPASEEEAIA